jgi:hypothetical protein
MINNYSNIEEAIKERRQELVKMNILIDSVNILDPEPGLRERLLPQLKELADLQLDIIERLEMLKKKEEEKDAGGK